MTQPLSEETLERLELKHRNCAETDHRCDAPQLIATIRGLEAENAKLRAVLEEAQWIGDDYPMLSAQIRAALASR